MASGLALALAASGPAQAEADEPGRFALFCAKALTCADAQPVVDDAVVLVAGGRIEAVGRRGELAVPSGYAERDLGALWLMPGMVDLHSHVAGTGDINGAVYQTNPGLRVRASVVPDNPALQAGLAAGVTTILFIPGSATNIGGQGVLLKTAGARYEDMLVRDPGSLKLAQADNPKAWGWGMNRICLNWQIRDTLRRGCAYARAWAAFEAGTAPEPERRVQYDVFRDLVAERAQIAAHTQQHQVVASTIRIARVELGLPVFIDHGTFDGFLSAEYAEANGVPAILGPRNVSMASKGRGIDHDGKVLGVAAEYQARGHSRIGFNTDAPVLPEEELPLQAAIGVRYGFDDAHMDSVRGLTIVPARTAGIDARVGSLEPGKDADLVALTGHPADPRSVVHLVWVEGALRFDAAERRAQRGGALR